MPNKGQNRRPKGFMADKKPSQERMKPSVKEKEKEQKEQKPKDKDKK